MGETPERGMRHRVLKPFIFRHVSFENLGNPGALEEYCQKEIFYFLTDLYLQVKSQIIRRYNNAAIPFPSNSWVMDYIQRRRYLFEVIQFFSEQFELIMSCIALLFGCNGSYLGKLFGQQRGASPGPERHCGFLPYGPGSGTPSYPLARNGKNPRVDPGGSYGPAVDPAAPVQDQRSV